MTNFSDFEQKMLENFKEQKYRSKKEIKEFMEIIFSLREKPEKNPQLKIVESKGMQ